MNIGTCSICGRLTHKRLYSSRIALYCGGYDGSIENRTDTNELKVNFVSDNVLSHSGFSMSYKSVDSK